MSAWTKPPVRIALIGAGKMARAHTQAYVTAARLFDLPVEPVLSVLVGHTAERTESAAHALGWQTASCDWRSAVERGDIDLVDVCTPSALHAEIACAAAAHGHSVVCEKPLATALAEATRMTEAVQKAGVANAVVFNYRYAPAVRHAYDLIAGGAIGKVREFRFHFLQDWLMDPDRLMSWRLSAEAGGGVLVDLGAHLVDMTHHLVGPITRVAAAASQSVVARLDNSGGSQPVDVEDAFQALLIVASGASGTLSVSRLAGGNRCQNGFEITGTTGSLRWDFQRMNELDVYLSDDARGLGGWRTVSVTEPGIHPWASHWWGSGHVLGYEATFVNFLAEFLRQTGSTPSFHDGLRCQRVLSALAMAADERRWVEVLA